ncbi:MAG TPA: M28 family peptidase [Gemmatimonadaceae bacterium]|nr:M28 family peptidase [Gemmatimonadaceae bacterium]
MSPLGDDGTYMQRFPVAETVMHPALARLEIGSLATWRFGADYWHVGGMGGAPSGELRGPVVIVSGRIARDSIGALDVKRKIVIYRSPLNARGAPTAFSAGFVLGGAGALAVLVPGERPDSLWNRISRDPDEHKPASFAAWPVWTATAPPLREGAIKFMPLLEVWSGRFRSLLEKASIDSATFSSHDSPPKVTPLGVEGVFRFERQIERIAWAPNVVGVLRGSDPVLRHEYIVVTAHLDGLGRDPNAPPGPGSMFNGADDNASGVAAIVQMAKAIASGPPPKRSVIFVAISGEELGLWGSDYFAARPPVPRDAIVANVNLDMVGRLTGDTLYLTGRSSDDFGPSLDRVVTRGSRGLLVLDKKALDRRYPAEFFDERSDHVNFRRRGIPTLSFFTGTHEDYHTTTDDAAKVNYEGLSRISGLATDIVLELANTRSAITRKRR